MALSLRLWHIASIVPLTAMAACGSPANATAGDTVFVDAPSISCAPDVLRVAIIQDISGSGIANITPLAKVGEMEPLIQVVAACGGDIGLGLIETYSGRPLVRLHVEPPAPKPTLVRERGNVFVRGKQKHVNDSLMAAYDLGEATRLQNADTDVADFRARADSMLTAPVRAKASDVWRAIGRAAQFMGEPPSRAKGKRQYRNIGIVLSDMENNVRNTKIDSIPGELVIVNGTPILDKLETLHPVTMESFAAAIRYILKKE